MDGWLQESEGEEAAESRVTLPQDLGHGNLASRQSRVRLHEVPLSLLSLGILFCVCLLFAIVVFFPLLFLCVSSCFL